MTCVSLWCDLRGWLSVKYYQSVMRFLLFLCSTTGLVTTSSKHRNAFGSMVKRYKMVVLLCRKLWLEGLAAKFWLKSYFVQKVEALNKGEVGNTSAFLSKLLASQSLSPQDVTGISVDLLMAAVETVSAHIICSCSCSVTEYVHVQSHSMIMLRSVYLVSTAVSSLIRSFKRIQPSYTG